MNDKKTVKISMVGNVYPLRCEIPQIHYIGAEAEELYSLETKRNEAIHRAAKELGKILGHTAKDYWTKTLPEALANTLEGFETSITIAAAIAVLRARGFEVSITDEMGGVNIPGT